jgi:basic membrane protein A and related proteins
LRNVSKIAAVAMVASLVLSGCGNNNDGDTGSDTAGEDPCKGDGAGPNVGIAYDGSGRGDKSFNDAAYAAIEKSIKDFDITCVEATPSGNDNDAARVERLTQLAEAGLNPVIATGYAYTIAVSTVAPQFPDTSFAVVDGYTACGKACGLPNDGTPNMVDLTFAEEQGSYLVGVAAALKSQSKHVGFVGGNTGPLITKFAAGYKAGAESVDPAIKVDVKFLTEDVSDIDTSFFNPTGAKQAAEGMIDSGADIIFQAAGQSGLGAIDAVVAAGEGHWAIGVDSDQYLTVSTAQQPFILTSMLKRVDTAIYEYIKAFKDGSAPSGAKVYDITVDGVGYSTSGGFVDDIVPQLEEAVASLKSGEIVAPTKLKN